MALVLARSGFALVHVDAQSTARLESILADALKPARGVDALEVLPRTLTLVLAVVEVHARLAVRRQLIAFVTRARVGVTGLVAYMLAVQLQARVVCRNLAGDFIRRVDS